MKRPGPILRGAAVIFGAIALAVSLAVIAEVTMQGRAVWVLAGAEILKADRLFEPLAVFFLAAGVLLRVLLPVSFRRLAGLLNARGWCLVLLLLSLFCAGLRGAHALHGDGREYIIQTQSLIFDRSFAIDTAARRAYWNRTNPYEVTLGDTRPPASVLDQAAQAGGGFGGLYPDRAGRYRYYHFWAYSAAAAPIYLLFHVLDPSGYLEYFSFRALNVLLLAVLFVIAYRRNPGWPTLAALGLLMFSPLMPYCDWQHPEIFCLVLAFVSFFTADGRRFACFSPLLLGLAASMNPPIILFFPYHLLLAARDLNVMPGRRLLGLAAGYAAGTAAALAPPAYYAFHFGAPNVIAAVGLASIANATLSRTADIFFNPFIGAVFFFPAALLSLPLLFTRGGRTPVIAAAGGIVAAAWLSTSTANFNSGQVGCVRYAVWLLAPLWHCLFSRMPARFFADAVSKAFTGALAVSAVLLWGIGAMDLLYKNIDRFGHIWRAQPQTAFLVRHGWPAGDAEVLVENILGRELGTPRAFRGVYMWDLGADRHIWVLSGRALRAGVPLVLAAAPGSQVSARAVPRQRVEVTEQDGAVKITLPDAPYAVRTHPVLGDYVILRTRGQVAGVFRNQRIKTRSDRIRDLDVAAP
ncbi:MAG: hypothetical protein FJ224_05860 [Lentisphaerae bacterium]|nr:hypothetical protein [Lentisphaerota bacterium]